MREHRSAIVAVILAAGVLSLAGAAGGDLEVALLPWLVLAASLAVLRFERRKL